MIIATQTLNLHYISPIGTPNPFKGTSNLQKQPYTYTYRYLHLCLYLYISYIFSKEPYIPFKGTLDLPLKEPTDGGCFLPWLPKTPRARAQASSASRKAGSKRELYSVYIYIYIYVCICIYVYLCICIYVYLFSCMYIRMYRNVSVYV